jgi:SAM-dependent methyltransferase
MGQEINLLRKYPKTKRDPSERSIQKTEETIKIAKQFGKDYFDGKRIYGYGGYHYNPIYWKGVVDDFINFYNITENSKILDIGSGKGFMMYDFIKRIPNLFIRGLDLSEYAILNSKDEIKNYQILGNAKELPFENKSFDLAISIVTLHNLNKKDCAKSLREISRVSKKNYITLDAYSNFYEKKQMMNWNLTAETVMHVDEWKDFFKQNSYDGDYYWFKP